VPLHLEKASIVLALVGMPGSGKSTVGRQLARKLGVGFVDCDQVIELRIGCPIKDYFASHGEAEFRDIETQVIDDMTRTACGVLATGGGAVLREANRLLLRERTHVIYLRVLPEEIFRRLKNDNQRPLLQVDDPKLKIKQLFEERDPHYQAAAHFVIETNRPRIPTMITMIVTQLELAGLLPIETAAP
jgi:shikimate kinase